MACTAGGKTGSRRNRCGPLFYSAFTVLTMQKSLFIALIVVFILLCGCTGSRVAPGGEGTGGPAIPPAAAVSAGATTAGPVISLPDPRFESTTPVETAIKNRRSVRSFTADAVTLSDISQLLWAAQGISSDSGQRTAPSAMRLYPLRVYVIAGNVTGLGPGVYRYVPEGHRLETVREGDTRTDLRITTPAAFVIAIDLDKKPGARPAAAGAPPAGSAPAGSTAAPKAPAGGSAGPSPETIRSWYYAETGHAAQNMYLQCVSLDLGMVTQAGFDAENLGTILGLEGNVTPYYLIPAGHPA